MTHWTRKLASPIWLVPILAALVAGWMVWQERDQSGPQIIVEIKDAEGLQAGKTAVRVRNVDVGQVTQITLSDSFETAELHIEMNADTGSMLVDDSQFWVVKPRIGRRGISGLNTLLSGAYVQLEPGESKQPRDHFTALEQPPVTDADTNGKRIVLKSDSAANIVVGDSVQYRGVTVGTVEQVDFSVEARATTYQVFIKSPYDELLTENTRFWLQRGVSFRWKPDGVDVSVGSVESLLGAGISFGVPNGQPLGEPMQAMAEFELFASEEEAEQQGYSRGIDYVLLLDESVDGLVAGSPVMFKGIRVGTVVEVPFRWQPDGNRGQPLRLIPVLIRYEPDRLEGLVASTNLERWRQHLSRFFEQGLRASIRASNILTNTLYVDLRFYPDEDAMQQDVFAGYPVMPTIVSNFSRLEEKLNSILDTLNNLPLNQSVNQFTEAMASTDDTAEQIKALTEQVKRIVEQPGWQSLPQSLEQSVNRLNGILADFESGSSSREQLERTLQNLEATSRDLKPLVETLRRKPNALLFNTEAEDDPEPKAKD
ncbi:MULTISPECIES: intermembrane transport protein PqiB [unclassified Idiomarina]|uniref:intermembrane transport protein PqiB n=1 Tax=unclassified Idiomarina TaxID=2614829 RepID=UPI000C8A4585|nr:MULTISPECIES: intermembrane transport protein PqiB [unclassified Idiomarina]MAD54784.1 paraquat-inducible protein B [Idiomarinaceae bacterium]MEC7644096.1 intermembrane transport protein PqiB [Pseudomonadota bacterium]NQZ03643.1 intermembrane transport protein PqiB [Idiomarina sp.]